MTDEEITRAVTAALVEFRIGDHVYCAAHAQAGCISLLVPEALATDHRPYFVRWDSGKGGTGNWCAAHNLTLI